jgi:hypothetical protein
MEQFNLERALAGEPVITRDGHEVYELVKFDRVKSYPIAGIIDGLLHRWTIDGKEFGHNSDESSLDLFMKPKENAIWVNVYKDRDSGSLFIGQAHREEEWAKLAINSTHAEFIRTIKIDDKK